MDNEYDTPIILTEEYANKVANGIAEGILAYLNIEKDEEPTSQQPVNNQSNNSKKIDVSYQVLSGGKWLTDVTNLQGYAGILGQAVNCFRRQYSAEMKQMQENLNTKYILRVETG